MSIRDRVRQRRFESPAQEAMVTLLVAAGHLQRALEDLCGREGITHDQYNVLRILRGVHPEGHPRYEIADRLIDRAPDVTRLVDRLEGRGLADRYRSDQDRRLSLSRITPAGLDLLTRLDPEIARLHARFAAALDESEVERLAGLCTRLIPE